MNDERMLDCEGLLDLRDKTIDRLQRMADERTLFWRGLLEERNAAIDRLTEENGALQVEIEALRCHIVERDQEIDLLNNEVERLRNVSSEVWYD